MTLNDVVAVVLLGPLIVALVVGMFSLMFFDGAMPHPFTAVGRARIRRRRLVAARTAALMATGLTEQTARRRAEVELEREAETAERELRRLGVDL
jgi:hypothetical protein